MDWKSGFPELVFLFLYIINKLTGFVKGYPEKICSFFHISVNFF